MLLRGTRTTLVTTLTLTLTSALTNPRFIWQVAGTSNMSVQLCRLAVRTVSARADRRARNAEASDQRGQQSRYLDKASPTLLFDQLRDAHCRELTVNTRRHITEIAAVRMVRNQDGFREFSSSARMPRGFRSGVSSYGSRRRATRWWPVLPVPRAVGSHLRCRLNVAYDKPVRNRRGHGRPLRRRKPPRNVTVDLEVRSAVVSMLARAGIA